VWLSFCIIMIFIIQVIHACFWSNNAFRFINHQRTVFRLWTFLVHHYHRYIFFFALHYFLTKQTDV
jgi:hypothetical protein